MAARRITAPARQSGRTRLSLMIALLAATTLALAYYAYDYLADTAPRVADHASLLGQTDIDYRIVIDRNIDDINLFAASRISDGILATTELLITRATNAANGLDPATEGWAAASGGGGARVDARIGEGPAARRDDDVATEGGESPRDVLDRYQQAMRDRNNNPQLSIYSQQTREMLSQRVMTPAQMDNVAKSLTRCKPEKLLRRDNRAVLRYPVEARTCSPYFFLREDDQWRLDFTVMINVIRFGRNNEWRLEPAYNGGYRFAFADLKFDRNGYPYSQ